MKHLWYKLYASSDAEGLYLVDDKLPTEEHLYEQQLRELLQSTDSLIGRWPSLLVSNAYANRKHLCLDFAMPSFVWRSAISQKAMELLHEELDGHVEWLPVQLGDGREFFLPHPLVVVDALDTRKSAITYVSGYPREPKYVTSVHKEWMRDVADLKGVPMFRTPETLGREVYISAKLADFIRSTELTGASFAPVELSGEI